MAIHLLVMLELQDKHEKIDENIFY